MAKKPNKHRASSGTELRGVKAVARKKSPSSLVLRTKTGRRLITSPAKSATSLASWSEAFNGK